MSDYWAKIYIEIIDDPKMATLPDRLWRRIIELFLLAKKLNNGGHLPDTKQIAWMLRMSTDDLDLDMKQIASTKIVIQTETGWFIPNFKKRQAAATNTERVHEFRKRKQKEQYYNNETEMKRIVTQSIETETETETEEYSIKNREDINGNSPVPLLFGAFVTGIQRQPYSNEIDNWTKQLSIMAQEGVQPEDITQAFDELDGRYSITSPKSIKTAAITCKKNRLNPKPVNKKSKPLDDLKFDNVGADNGN